MGDELRWEFRRNDNDNDSSSEESKSSREAAHKKHKLVSSLISIENDEEIGTRGVKQNGTSNPCTEDGIMSRKGKKVHPRRREKESLTDDGMERDSHGEGSRKKSKTNVFEPAAMDEVKRFMESLLEDLKVTRENLFSWMRQEMQKLVADDTLPPLKRREGSFGGKHLLVQHGENIENTKSKEKKQVNNKKKFEENILIQHQNNSRKDVLVWHETNLEDTLCAQHHHNLKETIQVQHQNNFEEANAQVQCRNNFESGTRAQKCNVRSLEATARSNQAAGYDNCYGVIGQEVDNGQATRALTPREKLGSFVKPYFQSCSTDNNVQMQHQTNYLLGIRPQNYSCRSLESPLKGKERALSNNNFHPLIEHQVDCVQDIGPVASSEIERGARLVLPIDSNFSNVSSHVASSMYLTLPSVLTRLYGEDHMLDTSSYNYIQPTVAGSGLGMNYEKANPMLKVNAHRGKFAGMKQQERNGSIAQIRSRNVSYFDRQSIPSSSIGTGFPVQLHQSMDIGVSIPSQASIKYLPRDDKNIMGLKMNEGANMFSGGSYAIPEDYVSNNFCSHSITVQAFKRQNLEEGHLFPK